MTRPHPHLFYLLPVSRLPGNDDHPQGKPGPSCLGSAEALLSVGVALLEVELGASLSFSFLISKVGTIMPASQVLL